MAGGVGGLWGKYRRAKDRARPHARRAIYAANRLSGRFNTRVWLIGEGRSGTTWIASLINFNGRMLERFEPFHPDKNAALKQYPKLAYRRPEADDPTLEAHLRAIFDAKYWAPWIDQNQSRKVFEGILIKDIFVSLLAKWAVSKMPEIKLVLLIRNPFSVARSKLEKSHWLWPDDVVPFLENAQLMADHLAPQEDILRKVAARDIPFLNHLAVWAIVHRVLFRQFARQELHVVFYEDASSDSATTCAGLDKFLGLERAGMHAVSGESESAANRVSTAEEVARARSDPFGNWRNGLSEDMRRNGMEILAAFGLDHIYDENGRPSAARIRFSDEEHLSDSF